MDFYDKVLFNVSFYDTSLPHYVVSLDEAVLVLNRWNWPNCISNRENVWHSWTNGKSTIELGIRDVDVVESLEPFFWAFTEEKRFKQKIESNIRELICSED